MSLQVLFKWSKSKLQLRVNYFRGANGEREKHIELPHEGLRLNTLFKKKNPEYLILRNCCSFLCHLIYAEIVPKYCVLTPNLLKNLLFLMPLIHNSDSLPATTAMKRYMIHSMFSYFFFQWTACKNFKYYSTQPISI